MKISDQDWKKWCIVHRPEGTYLGQRNADAVLEVGPRNSMRLSPAYSYQFAINEQGVGQQCFPLFVLPGARTIELPMEGSVVVPLGEAGDAARENVEKLVEGAERTHAALTQQFSRIQRIL